MSRKMKMEDAQDACGIVALLFVVRRERASSNQPRIQLPMGAVAV